MSAGTLPNVGRRRFNWKAALFDVVMIGLMVVVYLTVNAKGIRIAHPVFATKLYKTEAAAVMGITNLDVAHRLDMASCFSIVLLGVVSLTGVAAMKLFLCGLPQKSKIIHHQRYERIIKSLAVALFCFDLLVFYFGVGEFSMWGKGGGIKAFLLTIGYGATLVAVAFFHVSLRAEE